MATKSTIGHSPTIGHSSGKSSSDSSIRRNPGNDKEFPLPKCVPCLIGSGEAVKHRGLQSWPRRNMVHLYHGQWSACIMEGDGDALPCLKRRPLSRNACGTSTKTGGQVGVLLGTRMYDDAPILRKGFTKSGLFELGQPLRCRPCLEQSYTLPSLLALEESRPETEGLSGLPPKTHVRLNGVVESLGAKRRAALMQPCPLDPTLTAFANSVKIKIHHLGIE